jgi:hypothetical protein
MPVKPANFLRRCALWLLLGLATAALADDTRIELIELQGRSAEELIPLLQPVVAPDGALSGSGYRLIVRATPAQLADIHRLLAELDQPPQRLLLTVQMGELSQADRREQQLQLRQQGTAGSISVGGGTKGNDGLLIERRDGQDSAAVRLHSTHSLRDAANRQQVQAVAGQPAFIATGSERPYPSQVESWRGPRGGRSGAVSMEYKQAVSGFYAVARLRGDQVVVQISPQREAFDERDQGTVNSQRIITTVSGPLDSWLALGGSGTSVYQQHGATGRSLSTQGLASRPMWLKVELAP